MTKTQRLNSLAQAPQTPPLPQTPSSGAWGDAEDGQDAKSFKPLTAQEASALRAKQPSLSPWRVLLVQGVVGLAAALAAGLVWQRMDVLWSVLYGAATVVVPGALMARGMTSKLSSLSPSTSAVSFMLWEMLKMAASVLMLFLAPKIVQPLVWLALLAGLVLCIKVYWVALLWRGRAPTGPASKT